VLIGNIIVDIIDRMQVIRKEIGKGIRYIAKGPESQAMPTSKGERMMMKRIMFSFRLVTLALIGTAWAIPAQADEDPRFMVDPMADHVWGHEWPVDETVTVTRVGSPDETLGTTVVNEWGDWWVDSPLDIQAHDLIRAESDSVLREHVVTDLQITEVNYSNNTIQGTAQTGTWVNVNVWDEDISRDVEVDEHGEWLVDFNEPAGGEYWERAFDLEPGMGGAAAQFDEDGDETHIYWRLPDPVIRVNPFRNYIRGEGWPAGAVIEITIGDPGDPDVFATVYADYHGYWWFDPGEDYRIRAGDVITADDGTYLRSMTVVGLSVIGADMDADTLSGVGPSNVWVLVRVGEVTVEAQANNDGEWTANLGAEGINIQEGTEGYVYFYDEHDHSTYIFWRYATLDVEEIALIWVTWDDRFHFFLLEVLGEGILGARFKAPSDQWYELEPDDWELEWWEYGEQGESIAALDAKFEAGEYLVEITHYNGVSTAIVDFAETPEMPNAMPQIVSPAMGQSDVAAPEANLEWAFVPDPNFGVILAFYWEEFAEDEEYEEFIEIEPGDPFPTNITMEALTPDRVYGCEVLFINAEEDDTSGEVETIYLLLRANVTESIFSTNTDPDRFDSIERVDFGRFVLEANGDDPVHVFSFETYFTDSVASLFYEVILRSQDGDAHYLHHADLSPVHDNEILFEIDADDPDDLPGDGWHVLVLRPDSETAICTPFWFGAADRVSPLPMPAQQPVITQPLQEDLLASPVLITWEALTDPDVNTIAVIPADDEDTVLLDNLEQTTYGPIEKEVGDHLGGIIFAHALGEIDNDDGIAFGVAKFRATLHAYTVGHALTYIAGAGGELAGPTTQVVRDGEDGEEVIADPEAGAEFRHWDDGHMAPARTEQGVQESGTYTAFFQSVGGVAIDWYTVHEIEPEVEEDWSDVDQRYDPDKRMTLTQQFIADLNPTNPASIFRILDVEPGPPMTVYFEPGSTGRVYSFQFVEDLVDGIWSNVPGVDRRPGAGDEDSFIFDDDKAARAYFRIMVEMPEEE